ncbi:MAG: TetR/AcrR family transcriptional regulator [Aeromicrobium sp.]
MEDLDPRRTRILDAALEEFEEVGITKARVEAIAKRAGIGRATLYRTFDDKDAVVAAVLARKVDESLAMLDEVMRRHDRVEDRMVEGFVTMLGAFREDVLLQRLLAVEPESVTPWLTVNGGPMIRVASDYLAKMLRSAELEISVDVDLDVVAEMAVRIVHSLYSTPQGLIAQDEEGSRDFARRYMVDILFPPKT